MEFKSPEKIKIGKEKPEIEAEIKKKTEDVYRLLTGKREVFKEELPEWLRNLVKGEKIKIEKKEFGPNVRLHFDDLIIAIGVGSLKEPERVNINFWKEKKMISSWMVKEELARKIIKETKILGMVQDRKGNLIVFKEGRKRKKEIRGFGFEHIISRHFYEFRKEVGIKNEDEVRDLVLRSIKEAKQIKYAKGNIIYRYQTEKGRWISTVVGTKNNFILTSYPE